MDTTLPSQDAPSIEVKPGEDSDCLSDFTTPSLHDNISKHLHEDILGADFLVCLFWAAMNSFRHDSILRPFPSAYVEGAASEGGREVEGVKDIEGLVSVTRCIIAGVPEGCILI